MHKTVRFTLLTALTLTSAISYAPRVYACASCAADAGGEAVTKHQSLKVSFEADVSTIFDNNFNSSGGQIAWINTFWDDTIVPALKGMADELAATSVYQTFVVGTFFDAKAQLETQQSLQKIRARAHKDYHPSTGMCEFGTATKSLAESERKGELNALFMQRRSTDRTLGNAGALSSISKTADLNSRIDKFKTTYCNPADNNGQLDTLCLHDGGVGGDDPNLFNKDIDYTRTLDAPWTINVDFSDTDTKQEETDLISLANNLYGTEIIGVSTAVAEIKKLEDLAAGANAAEKNDINARISKVKSDYLLARSWIAKRSVAENSFNAMVNLKSNGSDGAKDYLIEIMKELGVGSAAGGDAEQVSEIEAMIGESPSYYAQMEILTKKLYQNPEFYTNLYDKPANVSRKEVAMQAIGLMQKFDLLKSYLRSEASLAVLLETSLIPQQSRLENEQ